MASLEILEISDLGGAPNVITLNQDVSSSGGSDVSSQGPPKSVNFGGGIELLMNDKRKSGGTDKKSNGSDDIALGDINELEAELNNLADKPKVNKKAQPTLEGDASGFKNAFKNFE